MTGYNPQRESSTESNSSMSPGGEDLPGDVDAYQDEQGRLVFADSSEPTTWLRSDYSVPVGGEE